MPRWLSTELRPPFDLQRSAPIAAANPEPPSGDHPHDELDRVEFVRAHGQTPFLKCKTQTKASELQRITLPCLFGVLTQLIDQSCKFTCSLRKDGITVFMHVG